MSYFIDENLLGSYNRIGVPLSLKGWDILTNFNSEETFPLFLCHPFGGLRSLLGNRLLVFSFQVFLIVFDAFSAC